MIDGYLLPGCFLSGRGGNKVRYSLFIACWKDGKGLESELGLGLTYIRGERG